MCKHVTWIAIDPDIGINLMTDDMDRKRIRLSHIRCDEAAGVLNVRMTPDGNTKKVAPVLKTYAVEWGGKIKQGDSSRREARIALQ